MYFAGFYLPINPSATTVYARSAFYPSLRFSLSLQSAFYTQSAFYPSSAVCSPQSSSYNDRSSFGRDPFNKNSDRSDREKWSTSKGGLVFSELFWLDRTDPLSFGPKFPEILVELIAPFMFTVNSRSPWEISGLGSRISESRVSI